MVTIKEVEGDYKFDSGVVFGVCGAALVNATSLAQMKHLQRLTWIETPSDIYRAIPVLKQQLDIPPLCRVSKVADIDIAST
jgi:hypothetical protein